MHRFLHFLFAALLFGLAGVANAQATRTWVSGVGDDANPCSRTAPCKTFAGAISKTATAGEISVLDPGGYGAVTITKSITLQTDGQLASILHGGSSGIVINCGTCTVGLRNIRLNGAGGVLGLSAIRVLAASKVTLEDVVIETTSNHGLDIATAAATTVSLLRTTFRNVGSSAGQAAVRIAPSASSVVFSANESQIEALQQGILVTGAAELFLRDVTINGGAGDGIALLPTAPSPGPVISVLIENSRITDFNAAGINASGGNTVVRIGNSTISGNATGVTTMNNASVLSYGNNRLIGNAVNGTMPLTPAQ